MKKWLALLIFLSTVPSIIAQHRTAETDSLWNIVEDAGLDSNLINNYYRIATNLDMMGYYDSAVVVQKLMLEKAKFIKYKPGIAKSYALKGKLLIDQGKLQESETMLLKALRIDSTLNRTDLLKQHLTFYGINRIYSSKIDEAEIIFENIQELARQTNDTLRLSQASNNLGLIYQRKGKYAKSTEYFFDVISLLEGKNDHLTIAHAYSNLGISHKNIKSYKKSIKHHQKAINNYLAANYVKGVASSYINLGLTYQNMGELDSAIIMNQKALNMKNKLTAREVAYIHNNLGTIYSSKEDFIRSRENLMKALNYFRQINSSYYMAAAYANIGEVLLRQQKLDQAKSYLDSALAYTDSTDAIEYKTAVYKSLASLYEKQNKYDKALEALKTYSALEDSIKRKEHYHRVEQMEAEYQMLQNSKEKSNLAEEFEIQKLRLQKAERKRYFIWIGVSLLVVFTLLFAYKYYFDRRRKLTLIRKNQEYQKALQNLKDSRRRNEAILLAIPDILFIFDRNGRYLDIKTHDDTRLALPREQLLDSTIADVLPEEHATLFQKKINLAIDNRSIEIFEYDLDIPEIGKLSFEARLVGMDNSSVLCIVRDITSERKNILELESSREALRDANISKDKFFSIIAHDLKNPFNALIGFSSLLNEDFQEFSDEERMEYIKQIYQASESLFSLLENLLEWTKAKTGKLEFSPEIVDINAVIDQNLKILTPEARQKNIEIVFEDSGKEECYVSADKNMLTSIIRNLTANAIKFTHPGGRIVISIKEASAMVTCSVADNGVGISEEDLNKLFKIDSNVRKAGTENEQGTGLGLLLCKEFIEKNGGKISVSSQLSKGSTFSFTVPRTQ